MAVTTVSGHQLFLLFESDPSISRGEGSKYEGTCRISTASCQTTSRPICDRIAISQYCRVVAWVGALADLTSEMLTYCMYSLAIIWRGHSRPHVEDPRNSIFAIQ